VKIEAFIGAAPSSSASEARWIVNVHGRRLTLAVVHIVVLTGDISEQQLLQTVKPRAVAFDLDGPPASLRQLAETAAGEHVAITGYVRLGSRHFAVSGLDPMTP